MSKEKIPSRIQADTHKASDMQIVFMGYSKTDLTAPPSIPSPNTGMTGYQSAKSIEARNLLQLRQTENTLGVLNITVPNPMVDYVMQIIFLSLEIVLLLLATLHGMRDLSFLTRNQTQVPCFGSSES